MEALEIVLKSVTRLTIIVIRMAYLRFKDDKPIMELVEELKELYK